MKLQDEPERIGKFITAFGAVGAQALQSL